MLLSFSNTSGKEGRSKMLLHFAFLLVLATAANGQDWNRGYHYTEPERAIADWKPIYGHQPDITAYQTTALGSTVAQSSQNIDFNCPKQHAFYRYEQNCEMYIECWNYQSTLKVCPDGMFYKENSKLSEYPCAKPPEAQCFSNDYATTSQPQDWTWPSHITTQKIHRSRDQTGGLTQLSRDLDFSCPKRYAFYRYEQSCDIYVECRNFHPTRKVCPDGMHFKESPLWSEYPCAYPPEAQCLSREFALPARPTAECPRQFGNYPLAVERYPAHDSCSSYISCASGVAHVMNCTFGLVFNPAINLCDWPEQVPGCQGTFNFRCPVPHLGEEDMVINYRYPQDPECRYFFSCLNGNYRVLACDEGLLFDHRIGRCVEYDDFVCDN